VSQVKVAASKVGHFLADSGSELSILPKEFHLDSNPNGLTLPRLFAANNSEISVYGFRTLSFRFDGFNDEFVWRFIVADVNQPILGKDFLGSNRLLVDCGRDRLVRLPGDLPHNVGRFPMTLPKFAKVQSVQSGNFRVNLSAAEEAKLVGLLKRFKGLFQYASPSDKVKHNVEHQIVTTGQPCFAKPRRLFGQKLKVAKEHFDNLVKQGVVYRAESPWSSPLHMVPKADPLDPLRPVGDYRQLNKITVPDRYPMPNIADLTNGLRGCKVFSKLDLASAYHQIPVAKQDQQKTAIATPFGLFIYRRMPFGLRNAAQTFQRLIDTTLQGLPFATAYLDDMLVASKNKEEHMKHLQLVFDRLDKAGLRLKARKCQYFQTEISFVGTHISEHGLRPLAGKVNDVDAFELPTNAKGLKRFLGMAGFYHRFVDHYSDIASPLTDLLQKGTRKACLVWTKEAKHAFKQLKEALKRSVTLAFPASNAKLELTTDASGVAAGAVLHQVVDGKKEPLAFFSRKFTKGERIKSAFDRELLAVFLSLKKFDWLAGHDFKIVTDHKPLVDALGMKKPSPQQARWLSYISEFGCSIKYLPGAENVVADALSRPVSAISVGSGVQSVVATSTIEDEYADVSRLLAEQQAKDNELQQLFQQTSLPLIETVVGGHKVICDNLLRPYVPKSCRFGLFKQLHELSHPGYRKSLGLVSERYTWPGMKGDIQLWSKHCERCQQAKVWRHTKAPVGDIPTTARFHTVHIDLVGPLPPSNGFQYLVTIADRFTRWVEAVPVRDMTAETVVQAFMHNWVSRFGVPRVVVSDRGKQFESFVWSMLMQQLGIRRKRTTSYHPACNGLVERFHRTLKNALRARCTNHNWYASLPLVMLGLRSSISEEGFCPAQLLYGANLELPSPFFLPTKPDLTSPTQRFVEQLFEKVRGFPVPQRIHKVKSYVPNALRSAEYVWLKEDQPAKLSDRYSGPYKVLDRDEKTMTVSFHGRSERLSIDRLKPAFRLTDLGDATSEATAASEAHKSEGTMQSGIGFPRPKGSATEIGQVVLAKFPYMPFWPALVVSTAGTPLEFKKSPKSSVAVRFFGTHKFAYVKQSNVQSFEFKETGHRGLCTAMHEAKRYIQEKAKRRVTFDAKCI
jgi:cleavage and polyadenylation specificity factor subunit 1